MKKILKIVIGVLISFLISIPISFFGFWLWSKMFFNEGFAGMFVAIIAGGFYIGVFSILLTVPIYLVIRKIIKI